MASSLSMDVDLGGARAKKLGRDDLIRAFRTMYLSRRIDDRGLARMADLLGVLRATAERRDLDRFLVVDKRRLEEFDR